MAVRKQTSVSLKGCLLEKTQPHSSALLRTILSILVSLLKGRGLPS